jgi:transposase
MFIRKTKVKSARNGDESYYTYRIVETERMGRQVKQRTLLNLGKHFAIDPQYWAWLTTCIEQIISDQPPLSDFTLNLDLELENTAQRYAALIVQKRSQPVSEAALGADYQCVDINQVEVDRARSIGMESVVYHGIEQLELLPHIESLGFNSKERAAALGHIVGRSVSPGSERQTLKWLQTQSALGEIIDHDFHTTSLTRLYQVADQLYQHREAIEQHLYQRETELFNLERRIVLYDLTNTYFEGRAAGNAKAQFGRSKEKRSDCPLVTMGLVLDGDGFPVCSRIFDGNVSEPGTLEEMINQLHNCPADNARSAEQRPIIIMDAGIASEKNVAWLRANDYRYIVVSRERKKQKPDLDQDAVIVKEESHNRVIVEKVTDESSHEVRVYCHSEGKEKKEQSIQDKFSQRFEQALSQLNEGLHKKGCTKRYDKVLERIGRLKQTHSRVANDYRIDVIADNEKIYAEQIHWQRNATEKDNLMGVYCLRTNIMDWTADTLWKTYVMLTEIESTFRSLKTDFGLRPVYHQKEDRVSAHLFISLLTYHVAHSIRFQLKPKGLHLSWQSLREVMSTQQRVTVSLPTQDQYIIHLRTTSRAEPEQKSIYRALGLAEDRLGKRKTNIKKK